MNSIANWKTLVDRFVKKLSDWNAKLLSIGGRLTLIKSVLGSLGVYYLSLFKCPETVLDMLESLRAGFFWGNTANDKKIHWIAWDQVLASFDKGGMNIGSLRAYNYGLLFKWLWRFVNYPNLMWVMVLKALHGSKAGLDGSCIQSKGVWFNLINAFKKVKDKGFLPNNVIRVKVGNGQSIRFWKDNWLGIGPLKDKFGRLFHLDQDEDCTLADRVDNRNWKWVWRRDKGSRNARLLDELVMILGNPELCNSSDKWQWAIEEGDDYTVHNTRLYIDDKILPTSDCHTRWCKFIPRKINVFLWRVAFDRLPSRDMLIRRGVPIDSIGCELCPCGLESISHVLFECEIAMDLWRKCRLWCQVQMPVFSCWSEFASWFDGWIEKEDMKIRLYTIVSALLWFIWRFRNSVLFPGDTLKKCCLFDSIRSVSFLWFCSRKKCNLDWNIWLSKPL